MVELEQELHDLATAIDWPEGDLVSRVGQRVRAEAPAEVVRLVHHRRWRMVAAVAAAAVVVTFTIPASRAAIGDWFGVSGERIDVVSTPPTISAPAGPVDLALGPEVPLADLRAEVGFNMPVPRIAGFEHPDEVHVARPPAGGEATLAYRVRDDLPSVSSSGYGMLISAFRADLDPGLFNKTVGPDSTLEVVTVQGRTGYWIEGAPHEFMYRDANGNVLPERVRLAGNVLLWEVNGITVRIESALARDDVIPIADAMQ
jgi:hypothetical protein